MTQRLRVKDVVIPSAPFKNYAEIESVALSVDKSVKRIQIDVCDGKYVGSVSWPFTEYGKTDFEKLGKKDDFDVYLPLWEDLNYGVDLMVEHPEKYIDTFVAYGVDQLFIHFRSVGSEEVWKEIFDKSEKYSLELILALDVNTNLEEFKKLVEDNIGRIAGVQVMGIEKIGFQGQGLSEKSLQIVKELKRTFSGLKIYFDGAINEETIDEIKNSGVDMFCVGSFITQAEYVEDSFEILRDHLER